MGRLDGKVALITGAASGLGAATAQMMAREGARVMLTDISAEGAKIAEGLGGSARFAKQDVTDEAGWTQIVAEVERSWGRLDILVNNAGISMFGLVVDLSFDQWKRCISTDLDSVFLGTRAALPLIRRGGGGSIINISSTAGMVGHPMLSAYCAAKGGVRLFSKSVAMECAAARDGVRVNSVHPGIIDTPIFAATVTDERRVAVGPEPMDPNALAAANIPMGYAGRSDDIAHACVYLASDESRYVTGTEFIVDGGWCAG